MPAAFSGSNTHIPEAMMVFLQFNISGAPVNVRRSVGANLTAGTLSETIANVLAGVTGTIRTSAQDGCSIDLDNVAQVREMPCTHLPSSCFGSDRVHRSLRWQCRMQLNSWSRSCGAVHVHARRGSCMGFFSVHGFSVNITDTCWYRPYKQSPSAVSQTDLLSSADCL